MRALFKHAQKCFVARCILDCLPCFGELLLATLQLMHFVVCFLACNSTIQRCLACATL